ncbi:MAG: hypothetical protein LBE34_11640 [Flavobacteriaceae bacterium]|jgi:hypothetical protein|nr:hypothetical protein [Flavobacteriaceae bacterium]
MHYTTKRVWTGITLLSTTLWCGSIWATNEKELNTIQPVVEFYQSTTHAKYPGHFMNDFLKAFQKKFKDTPLQETELQFSIGFTVTESGELDNIMVSNITNPQLTTDIISIVKEMKKWQPAKENGMKIPSRYALPFYINIAEIQSNTKNIHYTASKEESLFKPASYPTGHKGFWEEYTSKKGPMGEANFVNDRLKYTYTLTIDASGSVVGVELQGIKNDRLKDKFIEDFTKVVTSMKKWNPGTYEGRPVTSRILVPMITTVVAVEDEY